MILALVESFPLFLVTYLIITYIIKATKNSSRYISNEEALSPVAVDIGFWGTVRIAWKIYSTLWGFIPLYQRGVEILEEYCCQIGRISYVRNIKSTQSVVICSDLKTIKEAFSSDKWLRRLPSDHCFYQTSFRKPLGILMGNGPYWSTARKIVMADFREHGIMEVARLERSVSEEVHLVLNHLRDRFLEDPTKDSVVFSPNHIFQEPVLNLIFEILFSRKLSKADPLEKDLVEMMNYNNDMFSLGISVLDFVPFLRYFPSLVPSLRKNIKFCHLVYDIVDKERETRRNTGADRPDLMDTFLKKVHEGTEPNYFTYENLQTTVRDLMMAGSDTTRVTLQHLILFMATNKKEQEKVQDEIDRVVGPHRFPTYTDRTRMIYTQAVILETLRLASSTPISIRMTNEDCQLGGMAMKRGTILVPLYLGVHHSKQIWEDPMVFKPTRFICETTGQITNRDKTLPFSYGARACPGEQMGRVSLFLFTVSLLRDFEWELSDMHPPPSTQCHGGFTRAPAKYYVKIRRRS